jgi:hypothetical protein
MKSAGSISRGGRSQSPKDPETGVRAREGGDQVLERRLRNRGLFDFALSPPTTLASPCPSRPAPFDIYPAYQHILISGLVSACRV